MGQGPPGQSFTTVDRPRLPGWPVVGRTGIHAGLDVGVLPLAVSADLGHRGTERGYSKKVATLRSLQGPADRPHDLRHTAARLMLADGVRVKVVSEMLGHGGVRISDTPANEAARGTRTASDMAFTGWS
jgi:integrase